MLEFRHSAFCALRSQGQSGPGRVRGGRSAAGWPPRATPRFLSPARGRGREERGRFPPPGGRGEPIVISPQATPLRALLPHLPPHSPMGVNASKNHPGGSEATCRQATDRRVPCQQGCRRGIRPLPTLASGMDRAAQPVPQGRERSGPRNSPPGCPTIHAGKRSRMPAPPARAGVRAASGPDW
jgi:hypothetical protein